MKLKNSARSGFFAASCLTLILGGATLTGCEEDGAEEVVEDTADAVEDTADDVTDAVGDAADDATDAVDDAADEVD